MANDRPVAAATVEIVVSSPLLQPSVGRCLSRKPHPALSYLQLERSSAILLDRPAHPFFHGLLHIYGPRLRSLFAHPEPDGLPNSARGREWRPEKPGAENNSNLSFVKTRFICVFNNFACLSPNQNFRDQNLILA